MFLSRILPLTSPNNDFFNNNQNLSDRLRARRFELRALIGWSASHVIVEMRAPKRQACRGAKTKTTGNLFERHQREILQAVGRVQGNA